MLLYYIYSANIMLFYNNTLSFIVSNLLKYKFHFFLCIAAIIMSSSTLFYLGFTFSKIGKEDYISFLELFSKFSLSIILMSISISLRIYGSTFASESIMISIRDILLKSILNIPIKEIENNKSIDIVSILINDTYNIKNFIGKTLVIASRDFITLIGGIIFLLYFSPKLLFCSFLIIPFVLISISTYGKITKSKYNIYKNSNDSISSLSYEFIKGIKIIQSFCLQGFFISEFQKKSSISLKTSLEYSKSRCFLIFLILSSFVICFGIVTYIGLDLIENESIEIGSLMSFVFFFIIVAGSIQNLSDILSEIQKCAASIEKIQSIIKNKKESKEDINIESIQEIEFDNVNFSYSKNYVLKNISFKIKSGENIAIVGTSGSGKSTLISLILKFYEPNSGNININGINLNKISDISIRKLTSLVLQEPTLFSGSAYHNMILSKQNSSIEEIYESLEKAQIKDFFINKNNINKDIGEMGENLSGGQRQRLSIARAILKKSDILILDEPTSSLDLQNEKMLYKEIKKEKFKIKIIISHRIDSIKDLDRIIVMHEGEIVEQGKHNELIEKKGFYYNLFSSQNKN